MTDRLKNTENTNLDPDQVPLSNHPPQLPKKGKDEVSGWVVAGYLFAVLGGWLGSAIGVYILMSDNRDKKHGIAILVIGLFSQVAWLSILR